MKSGDCVLIIVYVSCSGRDGRKKVKVKVGRLEEKKKRREERGTAIPSSCSIHKVTVLARHSITPATPWSLGG
jgi:hypothetical protein